MTAEKHAHLAMIQDVINRLSHNSFLLKGWSVVLVSAMFALAAKDAEVLFVYLAYFPAASFWGLDGYFLSLERRYRMHYDRVRSKDQNDIDFSMDIGDISGGFGTWCSATISKTLIPFHSALIVAITVVMLLQS